MIKKIFITGLLSLSLLLPDLVGAQTPAPAKKHRHRKAGFFTRINRAIKHKVKMSAKKTRRAIVKTGCAVENGIMDSAVSAGRAITGKKKTTFVKGHYKKGNKHHTKGHFRRVIRHKKKPAATKATAAATTGQGDLAQP